MNAIEGTCQHSHEVPSAPERVVFMRDGNHEGTSVWYRDDGGFFFASHDQGTLEHRPRCVYVIGHDANQLGDNTPYACDLSTPRGSFLIGVAADDDLAWLTSDAEVIWDSASL